MHVSPTGSVVAGAVGIVTTITLNVVLGLLRVYAWWSGFAWGALLAFAFGAIPLVVAIDRRVHRAQLLQFGVFVLLNALLGAAIVAFR